MERSVFEKNPGTNSEGRIAACIFDLDGTLIDSEPNYKASDSVLLGSYGVRYDEEFNRAVMGRGAVELFRLIERAFPESPLNLMPMDERVRLKDEAYLAYAKGRTKAFPCMKALAELLSGQGLPLALASGSSPDVIDFALGEAGLSGLFSVIVSAAEVPRGKPEPDIFLEASRRLGVSPAACVVFEDSHNGVLAAYAAGMACVALPESGSEAPAFARAARVFPGGPSRASLDELLAALRDIGPLGKQP
jgi:HAD superfamily hydrolase (TIGR01509 family)